MWVDTAQHFRAINRPLGGVWPSQACAFGIGLACNNDQRPLPIAEMCPEFGLMLSFAKCFHHGPKPAQHLGCVLRAVRVLCTKFVQDHAQHG